MTTRDWAVDAAEDAMLLMQSPVIGEDGKMVYTDAEIMQVIAARIRTHYYAQEPIDAQPQPVAQGEAAGEFYVKCVRCHGEGMADIYVGSTGGSFNQPPDPVFERDACPECEGACFVPATPTIPTGHRVVPDALPDDAVIFGDDDDDGYRMGWNACRKAMIAAAPDAGGV